LKGKTLTLPLATLMIVSFLATGFVVSVGATPGAKLAFDPNSISWLVGSEPAGLTFDVDINITDVLNLKGVVVSVEWDPTYIGVTGAKFTGGTLLPGAPPDATGWMITWNEAGGQMQEAANQFMAGYGPVNVSSSSWELVGTMHFIYVGATPPAGTPVDTYINITKQPTISMDTKWRDSSDVYHDFDYLIGTPTVDQVHFHYEAVIGPPVTPVASFVKITGDPIYEGDTVSFDATGSLPGYDGDSVTPITEYWWSFEGEAAALGTATPSHLFATAGLYSVCLYVVAPGVPPYIDALYVNTSATVCKPVTINLPSLIGIDVYTEDYRWPGYTAVSDGTGPEINADAFMPQENIDLYAYVFYNGDPVQNKLVEFDIWGPDNPYGRFHYTRTAISGTSADPPEGVAWIDFRVPWPCVNATERVFGVWCVTVKVALPDVKPGEETVYNDTVCFKVGWIVSIVDLWTVDNCTDLGPKDTFKKCETIGVVVNATSLALGPRDAILAVAIYDDVGTCVAWGAYNFTVAGEAEWCTPQYTVICVELHAPKWAYAGPHAKVFANLYTDWPEACGIPWSPEASHSINLKAMST
jgi:hypothetical protein